MGTDLYCQIESYRIRHNLWLPAKVKLLPT
jgi:hypothetical protein